MKETILSVIPGADDQQRLVLVLCQAAGSSRLELRQQSWGEGVGWFTQTSLPIDHDQVPQIRGALGGSAGPLSRRRAETGELRLVRA